jgi:hypothetical protein
MFYEPLGDSACFGADSVSFLHEDKGFDFERRFYLHFVIWDEDTKVDFTDGQAIPSVPGSTWEWQPLDNQEALQLSVPVDITSSQAWPSQGLQESGDSSQLIWAYDNSLGYHDPLAWAASLEPTQNPLDGEEIGATQDLPVFDSNPTSMLQPIMSPMLPQIQGLLDAVDGADLEPTAPNSTNAMPTSLRAAQEPPRSSSTAVQALFTQPALEQRGSSDSSAPQRPTSTNQDLARSYECQHCSRSFTRRCDFKKHVDRHNKPHVCKWPDCGKAFGSFADLERHQKTVHNKQGQFLCGEPACKRSAPGKGFERKEHLQAHMKRKGHCPPSSSAPFSSASLHNSSTSNVVTVAEAAPKTALAGNRKRHFDQLEIGNPVAVEESGLSQSGLELGCLRAELSEVKRQCEELREENKRSKERHEKDRRKWMDVIERMSKE